MPIEYDERDVVVRMDLTHEEWDRFVMLQAGPHEGLHQVIWRLACNAAAYSFAARGDIDSAHVMAIAARQQLP